jgi:hypothetical protein
MRHRMLPIRGRGVATRGTRRHTQWFGRLAVVALLLGVGAAYAGPKDDVSSRRTEFDRLKGRVDETAGKVEDYLRKTAKLREMDKTELHNLITEMCKLDIARSNDEADRLAQSLRDKVMDRVQREYTTVVADGDRLNSEVERLMNDLKSLVDRTSGLKAIDEVKDDASRLVSEEVAAVERSERLWGRLQADYTTLTNIKEGVMNGSNNPRIRAAMEYGKEKHTYNQRICEEKELSLPSGRPDCVSFQKDDCAVWEFKPDTVSESTARGQAAGYLRDVQERFKDDPRALANCKKTAEGKPIFEARGVLYPACRP